MSTFLLQGPAPPPPPVPPLPPDFPFQTPGLPFPPAVLVIIVLASLAVIGAVLWPIARAIARRLEGRGGADTELRAEVEELRMRVAELENRHMDVAELEERLDFAERLLSQQRDASRLSTGGGA